MSVITIDRSNFDPVVRDATGPVLLDFSAGWCPPCRMLKPVLGEVATDLDGIATVGIVDVDASTDLAQTFGIRSIPALKLLVGGEVVAERTGFADRAELVRWVNEHAGAAA